MKKWIIYILSVVFLLFGIFLILVGVDVIRFTEDKEWNYLLSEYAKVGDYVSYDAGVWDADVAIPNVSNAYTLGGYSKGVNRSNGVTCDFSDEAISGWRIFDISEEGVVTIVQSGLSMCYYHPYGKGTNSKSLNILSVSEDNNFDYYVNSSYATSSRIMSKDDLELFYGDDVAYKRISDTLVKIGSPYFLASKNGEYDMWYVTEGGSVATNKVGMYGVRVLVTLKEGVLTPGLNDNKEWILSDK